MVKLIFFAFRKDGLTREEALAEAGGERHASFVRKLPGVRRGVLNRPVSEGPESAPDWVGELWFDDQDALDACLNSQEMADDFEDAKRFADLDKVYSLVVEEQVYIG